MTRATEQAFTPEGIVRRFLAYGTGCSFAATLAKHPDGLIEWATQQTALTAEGVARINTFLDQAGNASRAAVVVFPELRSASDICGLIRRLVADARWTLERSEWREHARPDILAWIKWRTSAGRLSSAMGLAPLGSMPVHRRAPFVAIALWPGGRENRYRQEQSAKDEEKGRPVGFLDIKIHEVMDTVEQYRAVKETTEQNVGELKKIPAEGAAWHDVTFCLPADVKSLIFGDSQEGAA